MTGPPLSISMDFIAGGLVELVAGLASAAVLFGYAWWAPLAARRGLAGSTHWLLRESGVWRDRNTDEVRSAQRDADYAYRLAVDPPAAKELRLFGLAGWAVDRFIARRTRLHELQYEATRLRERSVLASLVIVLAANLVVFWSLADAARRRAARPGPGWWSSPRPPVGTSHDRLRRAQLGARRRRGPGRRRRCGWSRRWRPAGALPPRRPARPPGCPRREIRFRDVTFAYPGEPTTPVLDGFDLTIPAGTSLAIVGQNGAGKTTLAKLLCRLYDPDERRHRGRRRSTCASSTSTAWRSPGHRRVPGLHPLRAAAARQRRPRAARPTRRSLAALAEAGAADLADLDTVLAKGYAGGTDLSGGQWQRVALARALCAVRLRGRRRAARRADRPARRARRGRDLRAGPGRDPGLHDDPRSRTASRPCARPTASACSSTAGWSSSAPTTS